MKIALVRLSALGDILFSMSVLQWIKSRMPHAHISWVVEQDFSELVMNNPYIDEVLTVNIRSVKKSRSISSLIAQINRIKSFGKFDMVIDLQGLIKSALVSRFLGSNRIGFDSLSAREQLASFFYTSAASSSYNNNIIFRYKDLIDFALDTSVTLDEIYSKEPFLYACEASHKKAQSIVEKQDKVCLVVVGASRSYKTYPPNLWAKVINALPNVSVLLCWGNEEEKAAAVQISQLTNAVVLPRLSIDELKALVIRCDLVMGGDTGITHFAWAANRPSVTIFGATPYQRNTLQTDINLAVHSSAKINPSKLDYDDHSIEQIEPSQIVNVAMELLCTN